MKSSRSPLAVRKSAHAALVAAIALPLSILSAIPLRAESAFRSITVDTAPLGQNGGSSQIRTLLQADLAAALNDGKRGAARGKAHLIVRITDIQLASEPDFGGRQTDGARSDYMDGEAMAIAQDGAVLARYPLMTALAIGSSGWYLPDYDRNRLEALCRNYAYWLKKKLQP